jgi:hypothetical protein
MGSGNFWITDDDRTYFIVGGQKKVPGRNVTKLRINSKHEIAKLEIRTK